MTLAEKIKGDLEQAIRQRDTMRRSTLRLILANIHNAEIEQRKELDEADTLGVLAKEAKKRRESIEAYEKGNRPDLVEQEKAELAIITEYLPEQMSRDEIAAAAKKIIDDIGASGPGDKGKVMSQLMPQTKGKAEGKVVSDIVTELLSNI